MILMRLESKIVCFGAKNISTQCFEILNLGNAKAKNYPELPIPLHKRNALKLIRILFLALVMNLGVFV